MKKQIRKEIKYSIFKPGGNNTALVYGLEYTKEERKIINEVILNSDLNIEQVGFISINNTYELQMAGEEFCGNATRSAASKYLNGKQGNIHILVNSNDLINAGVDEKGNAWCEIPLYYGTDVITKKEEGIFVVKMNGMVSIVIQESVSNKYLENKERLREQGMNLINKYKLQENKAVGVMFCEKIDGMIKINPIVWVKEINTLFYETACGSGTTSVCMVEAYENNRNQKIEILQPSGSSIISEVFFYDGVFKKAIISGCVETDGKQYCIELNM